ncbi:MAG: RNA polymerase sigma factor [Polyangiales bacterium]
MPSPAQFESVYAGYAPAVRNLLLRFGVRESDLDDLVQETFVTVHRLLPSFEGRSSLSTWLHSVTWRMAANHRRRRRRTVTSGVVDVADATEELELGMDRYAASFERIASEQRDLLALHEVGGLSISSLAELTGHARATIRQKLTRGRAALRRALDSSTRRRTVAATVTPDTAAHWTHAVPIAHAPDVRVLDDGLTCLSTIDHVVIALWRGHCTREGLSELFATLRAHARQHPGGVCYFSVVEASSTPPDREGRAMIVRAARELGDSINANATWIEDWSRIALVAAVLNATMFLARAKVDTLYFGQQDAALHWLSQYGELNRAGISAQVMRMKASLDREQARRGLDALSSSL